MDDLDNFETRAAADLKRFYPRRLELVEQMADANDLTELDEYDFEKAVELLEAPKSLPYVVAQMIGWDRQKATERLCEASEANDLDRMEA